MTLTVTFSGLDRLPEAPLTAHAGPVNAELVRRGLATTTAAARWLRDLPYGHNSRHDPLAVFRDGHGTCTTKHATYLTATAELDLDPSLVWGFYALTDAVVSGVGAVLHRYDLLFVPTVHCFIASGDAHVDLTEGNCNGKNHQITEYLRLVAATVGECEEPHRRGIAEELCATHPAFAGASPDRIEACLAECHAVMAAACRLSARTP